jgi:hypothetical protein
MPRVVLSLNVQRTGHADAVTQPVLRLQLARRKLTIVDDVRRGLRARRSR